MNDDNRTEINIEMTPTGCVLLVAIALLAVMIFFKHC